MTNNGNNDYTPIDGYEVKFFDAMGYGGHIPGIGFDIVLHQWATHGYEDSDKYAMYCRTELDGIRRVKRIRQSEYHANTTMKNGGFGFIMHTMNNLRGGARIKYDAADDSWIVLAAPKARVIG